MAGVGRDSRNELHQLAVIAIDRLRRSIQIAMRKLGEEPMRKLAEEPPAVATTAPGRHEG